MHNPYTIYETKKVLSEDQIERLAYALRKSFYNPYFFPSFIKELHLVSPTKNSISTLDQLQAFLAKVSTSPVDASLKNKPGPTLLHIATTSSPEITQMLIKIAPWLIMKQDSRGRTALHWATIVGNVEVFNTLVHGALHDRNAARFILLSDHAGDTALHLAVLNNRTNIILNCIQWAEQLGIKQVLLSAHNTFNHTAYDCAKLYGHENIIEILERVPQPQM